jgi:hypothetical protein
VTCVALCSVCFPNPPVICSGVVVSPAILRLWVHLVGLPCQVPVAASAY